MKNHRKKFFNDQLSKLNLDAPSTIILICDLFSLASQDKPESIKYTKQFFANYYCIDIDTFHKWVKQFCPDLYNDGYKKKRIFNELEVFSIYNCLGRYTHKIDIPRNHREVANYIFSDLKWRKSRKYKELSLEFENRFPNEKFRLNILPPKIVSDILIEYVESYQDLKDESEAEFYEDNVAKINNLISKYGSMSEHEKKVKLRWFRKWLTS